ncbi:hypothetical protein FGE12_19965 [Aggregicoccus sp. 17bor-14]|uniref:hypothetical protein n=1 Tax=Myxococcaceae TaxID=31 RepID=UPI00129CC838|nr:MULTISPECIES: hypothetical protein [Myxococcaceae]MBF5044687.1 hypothetical protein [Simulacricoccus sp. 17bor-14]MRI90431.1 hypothetical protein [Aggregicoccus sp. 17bor-14]
MKSMKTLFGAVAAVVLVTGCGSSSPCEQAGDALRDSVKLAAKCEPGSVTPSDDQLEELVDDKACETRTKTACTEDEAKIVGEVLDCAFGKLTCSNLQSNGGPTDADLAACDPGDDVTVREACFFAFFPPGSIDTGTQAVARKALRISASR